MANISGNNPPVLNDQDYVDKIKDSLDAIDLHDHTTGKGVPIGTTALADGSVTTAKLADLAVTAAKIANSTITATQLATASVTTSKLAAASVTNGELADSAVQTAKINDLAVTTGKLADLAVTAAKIADTTITGGKIASATITGDKLAATISGDHDYTGNVTINDDMFIPDDNDATAGAITALATTGKGSIRLTGAVTTLEGLANGADGKIVYVANLHSADFTISHEAAGATAANRIHTGNAGLSITVKAGSIVMFKYDGTTARWRVAAGGGGSAKTVNTFTGATIALTSSPQQTWRFTSTFVDVTTFTFTGTPDGAEITVLSVGGDFTIARTATGIQMMNGDVAAGPGGLIKYEYVSSLPGLVEVSRNGC